MTDSTPTPAADDEFDRRVADADLGADVDAELAPEEQLLKGWLPEATPTDGPAPAP